MRFSGSVLALTFLVVSCPLTGVLASNIVDKGNGTVYDKSTSLMWQQSDDGVERAWDDAVSYCESLSLAGHEDWKLPKVHLLEQLIDPSYSPTINPVFKVKPSYYWSATESRNSFKSAKYINFYYGNTYAFSKANTYLVICVRDASALTSTLTVSFEQQSGGAGSRPLERLFFASVVGGTEPYFFEWDFNDGEFSSRANPTHVFPTPGTYRVMLTISDNNGEIAVSEQIVQVEINGEKDQEKKGNDEIEDKVAPKIGLLPTPDKSAIEREGDESSVALADRDSLLSGKESGVGKEAANESGALEGMDLLLENASEKGSDWRDDGKALVKINEPQAIQAPSQAKPVLPVLPVLEESAQPEVGVQTFLPVDITEKKETLTVYGAKNRSPMVNSASGQGLLAYSFINAIKGDADWNKDNTVTAMELKGYLAMAIETLSKGQQEAAITVSDGDFAVCAPSGATYILAIGVNKHAEEGIEALSFAGQGAEEVGLSIEKKCLSWKKLVLSDEQATRNNILRAFLKMKEKMLWQDTFIFYYAGSSFGAEQKNILSTYDTHPEIPGLSGFFFNDLATLIEMMPAHNIIQLFEFGPKATAGSK